MNANAQTPVPSSAKAGAEQIKRPTYSRELLLIARTMVISTLSKTQDHAGYALTARVSPKEKDKLCEATPHKQERRQASNRNNSAQAERARVEAVPCDQNEWPEDKVLQLKTAFKGQAVAFAGMQTRLSSMQHENLQLHVELERKLEKLRKKLSGMTEDATEVIYSEALASPIFSALPANLKHSPPRWGSTEKDSDDETVSTAASDTEGLSLVQEIGSPPGLEAFSPPPGLFINHCPQ